jgi:hypothetical protein
MVAAFPLSSSEEDQHVVLRGMSWQDFEALLAIRGERSGVRVAVEVAAEGGLEFGTERSENREAPCPD